MGSEARRIPFEFNKERNAFETAFTEAARMLLERKHAEFVSAENIWAYYHGISWHTHGASDEDGVSVMESHSHEMLIKFDDIIDNNLSCLDKHFHELIAQMQKSAMKSMYQKVNAACESTGNTINAKEYGSQAQAFLEMLKKIEFGVDRDGKPTFPEIHAAPEAAKKLLEELSSQEPEFQEEVERIKAEKIALALEREKERKARFKR